MAASNYRKSSRSEGASECVEIAMSEARVVQIRDSKCPDGPVLPSVKNGLGFITAIKSGKFSGR